MSEAVFETLKKFRSEYPTPMNGKQAELLNRVAWTYRADGWGLLKKTTGNKCSLSDGVEIACDILFHLPSGDHFDVLSDVENAAEPVWRNVGPIDRSRFIFPLPVETDNPPPPPPPPPDSLANEVRLLKIKVDDLDFSLMQATSTISSMENIINQLGSIVGDLNFKVSQTGHQLSEVQSSINNLGCEASARIFGATIPVSCKIKRG